MRIATEFSKGKSVEEIAAFLQSNFHGGNGVVTESGRYSAWYADDGIHIANGDAARYLTSAKIVSWREAAERIGQLLTQGEYATNVELAEAPGHERAELAQSIWYLRQDLSEKARTQGYLSCLSDMRGGGFPEETARLAERLRDPAFREVLVDDFAQFRFDYREDRSLLRFHYHKPDNIEQGLRELSLPRREYRTEMAEMPAVQRFITEDEIAATLTRGSNIEGSKGRIYAYKKMSADYEEEQERLKLEIDVIEEWVEQREEMDEGLNAFIALTQKYVDVMELTQTIVNEYIKKIVVFAPDKSSGKRQQKVKIYFNFVDDVEIPGISETITTETTYGRRKTA